jgi:transposase
MLLLKSEGLSFEAIALKLDVSIPTVRLCFQKYNESGIQSALEDYSGRGRRAEIFDDSKAWVINITCQKPTAFGLSAELWYPISLTQYVNSVAEAEGYPRMATASVFSIRKILREAKLNPHKITYYCEKRDPDFDRKMHDVLVIYKQVELRFDENGKFIPFTDDEEIVHTSRETQEYLNTIPGRFEFEFTPTHGS